MGVITILLQELKILLRDRQALGLLFIMPLGLIIFLTMAMEDIYRAKIGKDVHLTIVTEQACDTGLCADLVTELKRFPYTIDVAKSADKKSVIALVLPKKIEDTVDALKESRPLRDSDRITLFFDPLLDRSVRALVQAHVVIALQNLLVEQATNEVKAQTKDGGDPISIPNATRVDGLVNEKAFGGTVLPNPIHQTVPAWALFGMFFILIPLSNSVIRDRRLGIFKRLLSFPVTSLDLLLGKVIPFYIINVVQFLLMFGVGLWLLPKLTHLEIAMDFSLSAILVITLVCALASTSYGILVACLVKTPEQAGAVGALSVVILAVIGGVMIPRFVMPEVMQNLAQISPLYWGLEAYQDITVRKLTLAAATGKLGVLTGFSLVCLLISWLRFQWNEG